MTTSTNDTNRLKVPRRDALAMMAVGTGALLSACAGSAEATSTKPEGGVGAAGDAGEPAGEGDERTKTAKGRMPVVYVPHGGGPWPFVEMGLPRGEVDEMRGYLEKLASLPKEPPKALLVISAHWEERVPTLMTHPKPPMFFDYYGFPEKSYSLSWPAPGAPELAGRVQTLLGAAGFETAVDSSRGFDHGTFVPLMLTYPGATIPTTQLSLQVGLDPKTHLAMGRALAPLRDEGVSIIGSGMSYHDMRGFRGGRGASVAETFDAWLRETALLPRDARDQRLATWSTAPSGRAAHPREEHLLPLMVVAGAAGEDRGVLDYNGTFMGLRLSGYHFG